MSIQPEFTQDDLSILVGACVPDAVAVLDVSTGAICGANQNFEALLGLEPGTGPQVSFEDRVHGEDLNSFRLHRTSDAGEKQVRFPLRVQDSTNGFHELEAILCKLRWKRREFALLYLRTPQSRSSSVEVQLREKIAEQKRRTLEAIKSSLLIYQFTEKIKKTPVLTTSLLSSESDAELFKQASRILCDEGLNYKDATFLLLEGDELVVRYSTCPRAQDRIPLRSDGKYTPYVRGGGVKTDKHEVIVPLRSRGNFLGLIDIKPHPRERIFFDEMQLVRTWQKDALLTIGDMIALMLDNLRLYREVKQRSVIDPLTGVYNRNYFTETLSSQIKRCVRSNSSIAMIFVDVDHFKTINDTFGHIVGDQILRGLGYIFKNNLREYDVVCRYGGDEFVILLPEMDARNAERIATGLLDLVRKHDFHLPATDGKQVSVSISLGVSVLEDELNEGRLLHAADAAMFRAKQRGRGCVVVETQTEEAPPVVKID